MVEIKKLKRKLEYHYKAFDKNNIYPDPICFPNKYKNYHDIEASAFISSIFAYGNIKQIMNVLEQIDNSFQNKPYEFIINYDGFFKKNHSIIYRFFSTEDINNLFYGLRKIYSNYFSLKDLFLLYYFPSENLKETISFFSKNILKIMGEKNNSNGINFMFPDPAKGSTCKRMNMFLRWMIRKDEIDFGLWKEFSPSELVIPVDTHIAKISKEIGLTKLQVANWKMAEDITNKLKLISPSDPVKYDFALCHLGMRKIKF